MMRARCPACQTVFRVRPEHLRARQGKVRCGHCHAAFNALENLHDDAAPAGAAPTAIDTADSKPAAVSSAAAPHFFILEEPPPREGTPEGHATAGEKTPTVASLADRLDFDIPDSLLPARKPAKESPPPPPVEAPPPAQVPSEQAPSEQAAPAPAVIRPAGRHGSAGSAAFDAAPRFPAAAMMVAEDETPSSPPPVEEAEASPEPALPEASAELQPVLEPPEVAAEERIEPFLDDHAITAEAPPDIVSDEPAAAAATDEGTPWDDTEEAERLDATYGPAPQPDAGRRWLWGIGTGILLGALAAQAGYLFRGEITRDWPVLRPVYLAACERLGCTVPLPREAAYIGIETSDLESEATGGGRYVLNAVIRNRADFPQAWPHLELTLTDARDLPAARRVIRPEEWVPRDRLKRGFAASGTQSVRLPFDAPDVAAVGYRIYAFYP